MTRPDYFYLDEVEIPLPLNHSNRPDPMDREYKMRVRAASFRVIQLYPGPIGEYLSRELMSWEDFGYRLGTGGNAMIYRIVEDIMKKTTVSHYGEKPSA